MYLIGYSFMASSEWYTFDPFLFYSQTSLLAVFKWCKYEFFYWCNKEIIYLHLLLYYESQQIKGINCWNEIIWTAKIVLVCFTVEINFWFQYHKIKNYQNLLLIESSSLVPFFYPCIKRFWDIFENNILLWDN